MKKIIEYINESIVNPVENLPKIETLGDGLFTGQLSGNCFTFEGKKYYSPVGILSIAPGPYYTFEIKEGKVIRHGDFNNLRDFRYDNSISSYNINESMETIDNPKEKYPNVIELGEGEYNGALWGHCFAFEGKKYYCECGWKNKFPMYCRIVVENGRAFAHQIDIYQRESLKKLYESYEVF